MALSTFLLVYVIGGVTFIPFLGLLVVAFAYIAFTKPVAPIFTPEDEIDGAATALLNDTPDEKSKAQQNELEVAAAYFAVCRDYVPGGINGKPPERSTPAGEVLIAESPSVYQSMYRSIFERGKTQIPTIEADKRDGRAVKKARNVFFVVLRHGHLMLYDDSEQVEVRHVISLAHHNVDVYAGGDAVPEGDLWIKRNCIRLTRKQEKLPSSRPFYFFSDNCSEKEDFYHALLLAQSVILETDPPPVPQKFETPDIIKLVQNLHSSDADTHSRWLNALIGRIFLAMYKTQDIENFIRAKINRKISRVPKPNFITAIQIKEIDMGDSGPVVSNPRLKELSVNGDMTVEIDIKYNGGFKLQMGAVARIDLGSRFKAREVHLVMAGILKRLSGHLLIRIKPPPSNRIWMTFETMPQLEMSIEPIVSSRQITYGIILRAIESRIREVIGETIVFPNWDDSPFLDTSKKEYRGGIFEPSTKDQRLDDDPPPEDSDAGLVEAAVHELTNSANVEDAEELSIPTLADTQAKTMSMPSLFDPVQKLNLRKPARRSIITLAGDTSGSTTGASTSSTLAPTPASPPLLPRTPPAKPKNMRSNSFASAATPLVSTEGANIEAVRSQARRKGQKDAVEFVKEVSSRSQPGTPLAVPQGGNRDGEGILPASPDQLLAPASPTDKSAAVPPQDGAVDPPGILRSNSEPSDQIAFKGSTNLEEPAITNVSTSATTPIETPRSSRSFDATGQSASPPSHITTAANAAKKWGWHVLNRQNTNSSTSSGSTFGFGKKPVSTTNSEASSAVPQTPNPDALRAALLAQPMGRGQPLPPPGTPLPGPQGPQKSLWSSSTLNLGGLKRKPVPAQPTPPQLPPRRPTEEEVPAVETTHRQPPPLPARPKPVETPSEDEPSRAEANTEQQRSQDPDVFVVAAPVEDDSSPATPIVELVNLDIPAHVQEESEAAQTTSEAAHAQEEPEAVQTVSEELEAAQTVSEEPQHAPENPTEEEQPIQHITRDSDEDTVIEPTKARPHDEDDTDGEIGDSLDAADVAGELGGSL